MMKRFLMAAAPAAFLLAGMAAQAADILVYDTGRVQSESLAGKDIAAQNAASPMEDPRTLQAKYERMLQERASVLSQQVQAKSLTEKAFNDQLLAYQNELNNKAKAEGDPMVQRNMQRQAALRKASVAYTGQIDKIIADIASKRGASVVLDKQIVAWSAGTLDVTSEVISRLDAALPGLKLDLPAAPAAPAQAAPRTAQPPRPATQPKR